VPLAEALGTICNFSSSFNAFSEVRVNVLEEESKRANPNINPTFLLLLLLLLLNLTVVMFI